MLDTTGIQIQTKNTLYTTLGRFYSSKVKLYPTGDNRPSGGSIDERSHLIESMREFWLILVPGLLLSVSKRAQISHYK
jgi:hypothetical protein